MSERRPTARAATANERAGAVVHHLGFTGDDSDLVRALLRGDAGAPAALFDRYGAHVRGVLARVLGVDDELKDVLHETFAQALASVSRLDEPARLKGWLTSVAVFTARVWIRRRQRQRWLGFFSPSDVPEVTVSDDHSGREALRRTYATLERMPTDERIAFSLRTIGGMQLTEVADACGVSIATIKRRLRKARDRFEKLAARDPVLCAYLEAP